MTRASFFSAAQRYAWLGGLVLGFLSSAGFQLVKASDRMVQHERDIHDLQLDNAQIKAALRVLAIRACSDTSRPAAGVEQLDLSCNSLGVRR
jgi:hypothetical protein